jgi:predicted aspartyl protease
MYMALIDTGASCTCISAKVIRDLGLNPIGKQPVGGVHGSQATNAYQFLTGIVFPQSVSAAGIMNATVMTFPVTGVEFVPPGAFDVLLGRDIICQGHFSMSFSGQAVLCL